MSTTTTRSDGIVCVPRTGTLYDVLELILDRGMVIDVFVRVSLVGIEILKIDARVVVASVDTYLRFAEACNRLDLESDEHSRTVPELFGGMGGGKAKAVGAKKAAKAVGGKVKEAVGAGGDEDEDEEDGDSRRASRSGARSKAVGASRSRRSQEG